MGWTRTKVCTEDGLRARLSEAESLQVRREGRRFQASLLLSGTVKAWVVAVREHELEKSKLNLEPEYGAPINRSGLSLHLAEGLLWLQFWRERKAWRALAG